MIFRGWPLLPEELAVTFPTNEQWNSTQPCTVENVLQLAKKNLQYFTLKQM
jgi:hypothetical protein